MVSNGTNLVGAVLVLYSLSHASTICDSICGAQEYALQQKTELSAAQTAKWIPGKATQLTFDGRLKHDPIFVNQGREVVFTSLQKFNLLCLMKLELNGDPKATKPSRLHPSANTSELAISFAEDENKFAYLRNNGNLHFEIVIENRKTGSSVSFNPGGGFAGVRNISFHPDGSHVIFAFPDQNGPQQIKTLSSDGKKTALLTNSEGINRCPRFSNDGKKVVFASSRDGDFDIFAMNSDGSHPVNVSKSRGLDTHPVFSPDSSEIAFTGLRNGNYDIYVVKVDGSQLRRLTRSEEVDDYPAWSPDGRSIIWVAERNGKRDLYSKLVKEPGGSQRKEDK